MHRLGELTADVTTIQTDVGAMRVDLALIKAQQAAWRRNIMVLVTVLLAPIGVGVIFNIVQRSG